MALSLTERWSSWWEEHRGDTRSSSTTAELCYLPLRFVERVVTGCLRKAAFQVPSTRQLQPVLEDNLEPLVEGTCPLSGKPQKQCTVVHLLNMVWLPVLQYIEALLKDRTTPWTSTLAKHQELLILEMQGVVTQPDESMPIDDWMQFMQETLQRLVDVTVPLELLQEVLSAIVPLSLHATRANALSILRTPACSEQLVGRTLGTQVSRRILSEVAEVPVPLLSPAAELQGLKQDLMSHLVLLHGPREPEEGPEVPAKKRKRDRKNLEEMMEAKTRQCLWILENRLSIRRAGETLLSARELIAELEGATSRDPDRTDLTEVLVCRQQQMRHMLLLDGAVDRRSSDHLFQCREDGSWAGVALATDESPLRQPRFRGLRFQITVFYLGSIPPLSLWESSTSPPIACTSMLADIMHCAGKKGGDVSRVLERQLQRVGLSCYDVVAATGDGGGENEGACGIHQHFEDLSPGYVRRRCLPHIAWRTADKAIRSSGLDYRALCAYFVEGITWSRLREIAVRGPADGGLGVVPRWICELSRDLQGSPKCYHHHPTQHGPHFPEALERQGACLAQIGPQGFGAEDQAGSRDCGSSCQLGRHQAKDPKGHPQRDHRAMFFPLVLEPKAHQGGR